jgi:cellulose synthase (UDP-forming)
MEGALMRTNSCGVIEGENFVARLLRLVLLCAALGWASLYVVLPLEWQAQTVLGVLLIVAGIVVGRASGSAMMTIALTLLSMLATLRYAWWRIGAVIAFFHNPGNAWDWVDAVCIVVLMSAEMYAFVILFLGFMQTVWPLKRPPVPLPVNAEEWPHVDLLIPTYNEPLNVVKYTAMAALNVDWPTDKLHIYILDDGRREAFREFAQAAGVGYMTRDDNAHAKAGNINRALERLDSPYVAIFDCDHLPTRSFLQVTMGWFLREQRLAMVQTPHHFYSADPFERNLKQFRLIPNEGELFYGVVQDGNDFWNATFFCGSCAVLRRTALDEIGGIAVETVTEDAHTSLRMQMRGWNTAYINIPQAAGLATERLSGHIQQRIRWARGMIQILRTDNPLFAKGLKFAQRICYFNAMTHFLYAVPRLIFLTAPLVYLFFSRSNVPGYWAAILAYALPHLVLSNVTNSRIQGQHRHSFWNEIYETVLAPYILLPTLTALINPKLGKFNVTAKGGFVEETYFDRRIARPFIVLLNLNIAGLLMIVPRLVHVPHMERMWDGTHPGTIAMNALWCLFNIVILGVAITVAREEIQRREQVRIDLEMPARIRTAEGRMVAGHSLDVSIGGMGLKVAGQHALSAGEWVTLLLPMRVGDAELPATVVGTGGGMVRLQFGELSLLEQEMLTTVLYSRADAWLGWGETREPDRPLRSFYRILKLSAQGLWSTFPMNFSRSKKEEKPHAAVAGRVASLLLLGAAMAAGCSLHAQRAKPASAIGSSYQSAFSLKELGVLGPIELHGVDSYRSISFSLPLDQIADRATLHLVYRFSPQAAASGRLKVSLNGTVFATVEAERDGQNAVLDRTLPVPAELLVRNNQLTFEFVGRDGSPCSEAAGETSNDALWGRIDPSSSFALGGQRLPLTADLAQLPIPLLDTAVTRQRVIPVVMAASPSTKAMQAAGVVASYFGKMADYPVPRFPVTLGGALPGGNVVVVAESTTGLPASLGAGAVNGPMLELKPNPNDPYGTLLIVTGTDGEQLLLAAQALALQPKDLRGSSATVGRLSLPPPRLPDDAPRWARSERKVPLWSAAEAERSSDGATPLELFLRVPPDLYYDGRNQLDLHLEYRYNEAAGLSSSLLVQLNGARAGSVLLRHAKEPGAPTMADVPLPVAAMRPFSNSLSAQWLVQQRDHSHCAAAAPTRFQGSILQGSYLDLRGLPHWAQLPNLELFSNAGFPFTRFADLSQTTVVLPDGPTPQELEVYLTLLAHFSAQTGYPALRVAVASAAAMRAGADTDFLVIGTAADNPAIALAAGYMPVATDGEQLLVRQPEGLIEQVRSQWRGLWAKMRTAVGSAPAAFDLEQMPDAILEGLASPFAPRRTLVVLDLKDASFADPFLSAFLEAAPSSAIAGDVSVLEDGPPGVSFRSFRVGDTRYALGSRPWLTQLVVLLIDEPGSQVLGLVLFSLLCAARVQAVLRRKANVRLHLTEGLL